MQSDSGFSLALVLAAASFMAWAGDTPDAEAGKIDYLISSIETLEGAEFVRNGKAYEAKPAADHLRLKLRRAGSRVKTAEDFIRYCASSSSMSGEPYQIRFSDGRVVNTEQFLREKLAELK